MINRNYKILAGIAVSITVLLVTVGNGCSKRADMSSTASSSSGNNSSSSTGGGGISAGVKSVSVVYQKQMLDQLTSCSGVISPSDSTILMYESKKGSISTYGSASTITPPMLMAVTNIAGEICNDLINQEKVAGQSRVFVGWGLGSANTQQGGVVQDSITRLSLSCWQKMPTSAESAAILDLLASVPSGAGAADKQALLLCSAMLSSLNSLLN